MVFVMNDKYKPVLIPILTFDAVVIEAKKKNISIYEFMRRLLFAWTLNYWSDPKNFE